VKQLHNCPINCGNFFNARNIVVFQLPQLQVIVPKTANHRTWDGYGCWAGIGWFETGAGKGIGQV